MKGFILILIALVLAGWRFAAFEVSLDRYEISKVEGLPVLTWESKVEQDAKHYEVHRRSQSAPGFESIGTIAVKGAGSSYEFVDTKLYKMDETVEYQLYAVSMQGQHLEFPVKHISYSPTAVRRTWGSIKAMFQ